MLPASGPMRPLCSQRLDRHWLLAPLGGLNPACSRALRVNCAQSKQGLPRYAQPAQSAFFPFSTWQPAAIFAA